MVAKVHEAIVHEPLVANSFSLYGKHHFMSLPEYKKLVSAIATLLLISRIDVKLLC